MTDTTSTDRVEQIAVDLIDPDPDNRPALLDEAFLTSVAQHGVLMPILVTPTDDGRYRLVAGERRYRAAAQQATIPASVRTADASTPPPQPSGKPSRTSPASTSHPPKRPARQPGSWPPG